MTIKEETINHLSTVLSRDIILYELMNQGYSVDEALDKFLSDPSYKARLYPLARLHIEHAFKSYDEIRDEIAEEEATENNSH